MTKKRRVSVIVSVDLPPGAWPRDIYDYVKDAVTTMWGSYEPPNQENDFTGHPLWRLTNHNIRVRFAPKPKKDPGAH